MAKARPPRRKPYDPYEGASPELRALYAIRDGYSRVLRDPGVNQGVIKTIHDQAPVIAAQIEELETVKNGISKVIRETPLEPELEVWRNSLVGFLIDPATSVEELQNLRTIVEQHKETGGLDS